MVAPCSWFWRSSQSVDRWSECSSRDCVKRRATTHATGHRFIQSSSVAHEGKRGLTRLAPSFQHGTFGFMGRRKRPTGNADAGSPHSVSETLLSLYDVGGFLSTSSSSDADRDGPRCALIGALRQLVALLERLGSADSRDVSTSAPLFVQVEHLLRELRDDLLPATSASQECDAELVLGLRRDLESAGAAPSRRDQDQSDWSQVLLGLSLVEALTRQLGDERDAIHDTETTLDSVFVGVDREGFRGPTRALQQIISVLERRSLLRNQAYLAALEKLVATSTDQGHQSTDESPPAVLPLLITPSRLDAREQPEPRHWHCLAQSATADDAVETFLRIPARELCSMTALLVVGDPGSGKTRLCDRIQRDAIATASTQVVRPNVPLDFLGSNVGEAEDRIVAMFAACAATNDCKNKTVLIVDDVDAFLLGPSAAEVGHPSAGRWKPTFLAAWDCLQESLPPDSAVLVVCTSSEESVASVHRFDRTYYLALPTEDARRDFFVEALNLSKHLGTRTDVETQRLREGLESVVESTAGRSYAEMMQLCRQALLAGASHTDSSSYACALETLEHLKGRLSSLTPASLRDSVLDSYVDLRVVGSSDLTNAVHEGAFEVGNKFPFRGASAEAAWNQLLATIVIPLCRSKELNDLLDCSGSGSRRVLAGGVLLTGPPGCGKSALALHCAKYSAWLSPSVKLLEVSCTSMIHKELGGSERAVHHLFEAARRASPCIVVLDGIENIAAVRGNDPTAEGTLDRVLSTLLVELDGVDDFSESGSFSFAVIGITSTESWIDAAVKRPGRLEKTVRLAIDWT